MSTSRPNNEAIFHAARDIPDPDRRRQYVREACCGDDTLIAHVEALLAAADAPDSLLDRPAGIDPLATIDQPIVESPGMGIGAYKLLAKIGEGGFGVVFLAEQTRPVRRQVALKVLKPGMDTRQVLARFDAERQALALMDHPNIARVFDGGTAATGRPYFIMELVRGVPITQFCDDARLAPRERLGLFLQVCAAVQHAHQKGIIHRDLKPSNVLVAPHDRAPVAKVIDFGVAKALGQELTDRSLHTGFFQMLGTPLYMSPEQSGQSGLDIDTRSDIYSLGVLLYELLTGTTPFDKGRLQAAGYDELRQIIREEEPPKPSTRISTLGPAAATQSANRQSDPRRLSRMLRGELDWVVMKCLEKDRDRRYETVNGLALDVQRYLADEPVAANPPSAGYKLRKFVRRHWGPVLAASVILLSLVGGIVGTTLGLFEAWRQEQAAVRSAGQEKKAHAAAVESEADTNAYADFLANYVLAATRPEGVQGGIGRNVTMEEALARAEPKLGEVFRGRPRAEALARHEIGVTWRNLGRYAKAEENLRLALALRERELGPDAPRTLDTRKSLAVMLVEAGRADEAVPLLEQVAREFTRTLGPDDPYTLNTLTSLAKAYQETGRPEMALPLLEAGLPKSKVRPGPDNPDTLTLMNNLALAYQSIGRHDAALTLVEEVYQRRKARHGADSPGALVALSSKAWLFRTNGQPAKALVLYEPTLAQMKVKFGPDHPRTLESLGELGAAYVQAGQPDRGLPLLQQVSEQLDARLGADHPLTLEAATYQGIALAEAGQAQEGLATLERVLERRKARLGPDHPDTLRTMSYLGERCRVARQTGRAVTLLEQALARQQVRPDPDHPDALFTMRCLATAYHEAGQREKALPLFERTLARQRIRLGPEHPETLVTMNNLAVAYQRAGRTREALPLLEIVFEKGTSRGGPDHPATLAGLSNLAGAYWRAGHRDRGLTLRQQSVEGHKKRFGPRHPFTLHNVHELGVMHAELGQFDRAHPLLAEAWAQQKDQAGADHPQTLLYMTSLAAVYGDAGQHAKAEPLLRELLDRRRRKAGPESPAAAEVQALLSLDLVRQQKYAEAEPMLRECLKFRAGKNPDDWRTDMIRMLLGTALLAQEQHAEAEPLLDQAYQGLKKREGEILPVGKRHLTESLERLVRLCDEGNRTEQASAWRAKLEAHKKGKQPKE
jgi:serine/threonine protein kinase/tetratricopeptide (TPR) repeat protein